MTYRLRVYGKDRPPARPAVRHQPVEPRLPSEPKLIRVQFDSRCCECGLKLPRFAYALWLGGGRVCCEDCPGEVTTPEELLGPDFG
jgi:hypothetical protein